MPKREDWIKRTDRGWFCRPEYLHLAPNARQHIDPEELATLEAQVRADGVKEAMLCRRARENEGLEVWDGQRRLLCVRALNEANAGIEWVPVRIERGSDAEMLILAAQTATGKAALVYSDQVRLVSMLLGYGVDRVTIARRLGMSPSWVSQRETLIEAEPILLDALGKGEVTLTRALQLASKPASTQTSIVESIRERRASGDRRAGSAAPKRPGVRRLTEAYEAIDLADTRQGTPAYHIATGILLGLAFARGDESVDLERLLGEVR